MSESMRTLVEVIFNISYLIVVWALVIMMVRQQARVQPDRLPLAKRVMWAFALLALGDTGHVGFRVLAYATGGLEANPTLVGLGALATAITVMTPRAICHEWTAAKAPPASPSMMRISSGA